MSKFFRAINGNYYPVKDIKWLHHSAGDFRYWAQLDEDSLSISGDTFRHLLDFKDGDAVTASDAILAPVGWQCITYDNAVVQHPLIAFRPCSSADYGDYMEFLSPWGAYDYALAPDGRVYSRDQLWLSLEEWVQHFDAKEKAHSEEQAQ